MKTQYKIPPYLGLNSLQKTDGGFELQLGFSNRLQKHLWVDKEGLDCLSQGGNLSPATTKALVKENILKPEFRSRTPKALQRYDRHMLFYQSYNLDPIEVQKLLATKTVALIGMGGIGNWVGLNLIGAGFKELRLIDFDIIELSNLTRQILFSEKDLGKSKVSTAKKVLSLKNRKTKIKSCNTKVTGVSSLKNALSGVDFIIVSADRPAKIHDWVNDIAVAQKIPYLNIGYRDTEGVVGPLTVPGKTSCYQCFKHDAPKAKPPTSKHLDTLWENKYQAPSFGPLNAIISSLGATEVIKFFTKFATCQSYDTELAFDPNTFQIHRKSYNRDRACTCCGNL